MSNRRTRKSARTSLNKKLLASNEAQSRKEKCTSEPTDAECEEWERLLDDAEREVLAEQALERKKLREVAKKIPGPATPNPRDKIWNYLIARYGFSPQILWTLSIRDMERYIEARRPENEEELDDTEEPEEWEFAPGKFRYLSFWHKLEGQKLRLLDAFVKAHHHTLTHDQINQICGEGYNGRHYAYVSELNRALCGMLNCTKAIHPIARENAYRLELT